MTGDFDYVRNTYKVPAKRGGRVRFTGSGSGKEQFGTIKSAKYGRLQIQMDGDRNVGNYHPTWCLEYVETQA